MDFTADQLSEGFTFGYVLPYWTHDASVELAVIGGRHPDGRGHSGPLALAARDPHRRRGRNGQDFGAAPIAVPALAHPAAVRQAFGWVAPGTADAALSAIIAAAAGSARWAVVPASARRLRAAHLTDALAASLDPWRPCRAWAAFARAAFPATAARLALAAGAWAVLARGGPGAVRADAVPAAVRVLFTGLAALTAPHMLLTALAGDRVGGEAGA